jgi:hypothetical protein
MKEDFVNTMFYITNRAYNVGSRRTQESTKALARFALAINVLRVEPANGDKLICLEFAKVGAGRDIRVLSA